MIKYPMTDRDSGVLAILAYLKEQPQGASVLEMADSLHINRNTAARYLDLLLLSGKVEMRRFGKAKVFHLSHRVPVSAMLNLSSEMVLVINARLEIIQANRAVLEFLSCEAADLVGSPVYDGPARRFCEGELVSQLQAGMRGASVRDELEIESTCGPCVLDMRIYPIVLSDGNSGVTLIFDDITARVQAEATLAANEATFRRIVETVQDVLWSVDAEGIITYMSPGITRVTGHTPAVLEGKPLSSLIAPREAGRFAARLADDRVKLAGFSLHEMPVVGADGVKHYCDFTAFPLYDDVPYPVFLGYSGALHDISGRYEAELGEKRWRLFLNVVMENIPAIITASDLKTGQCYYANLDAERFFRMSRGELMHTTIHRMLDDLGSAKFIDARRQSAEKREKILVTDTIKRGKKENTVSARFVPLKLSADHEYIIAIFFVD